MDIPSLPQHPTGGHWDDNIHTAYSKICTSIEKALSLLWQDNGDPARLFAMLQRLEDTCVPLLSEMEKVVGEEWSDSTIKLLGTVMAYLEKSAKASQDRYAYSLYMSYQHSTII